jgi:hypothetical protein
MRRILLLFSLLCISALLWGGPAKEKSNWCFPCCCEFLYGTSQSEVQCAIHGNTDNVGTSCAQAASYTGFGFHSLTLDASWDFAVQCLAYYGDVFVITGSNLSGEGHARAVANWDVADDDSVYMILFDPDGGSGFITNKDYLWGYMFWYFLT